ncbi:FAD-binding oxidoreductase [Mesobacillus foraminis]|uniref:FAD-binding oxidoreductase n=1 Tax=Mesobacillus foraminis TaxID=279826 RepID=UPI002035E2DB|nr:FAD-binding oxidoreductase [Mesobacillus foraminis]
MLTLEGFAELQAVMPEVEMREDSSLEGTVAIFPKTEEDIASILKYCNEKMKTVSVSGGGTKRLKAGEEKADIKLSLAKYTGIVEHIPGDMTVTVKAGTRYQELQDYLAGYNQKVALDPSWPEFASVGGVVAANDSGPKRLGYGTARDAVIGLRTVYPDGRVIRSGGKVVKNVAGYDMNKLFIGSMGTLGVISEITLKLRPLPKAESLVLLSFTREELGDLRSFACQLLDSMMEPAALELLNPALSQKLTGEDSYTLAISFEDVESSVAYQEEFVKRNKPENSRLKILQNKEARLFWKKIYSVAPVGKPMVEPPLGTSSLAAAALKIGVVNLNVIEVAKECQLITEANSVIAEAHGGLGTGVCQVVLRGACEDISKSISYLRDYALKLGGYATVKQLPHNLQGEIDVWGEKPSYFFLLEGIKKKIDPNKILNTNRFVGGI